MQKLLLLLAISICLVACMAGREPVSQVAGAINVEEPASTYTPYPTYTRYPTHTPYPTQTSHFTYTPYPTLTPYPTATPLPPTATMTLVPTTASTSTIPPTATATALLPTPSGTPPPTVAPTETPAAVPVYDVRIVYIFFDGEKGRTEPDEYCEIRNMGENVVDLQGWRLNAGAPGQDFRFPAFDLALGQAIRVYTNEVHIEHGGFSFAHIETALWSNKGDCGYLFDAGGEEVSRYCY
jgi:hypothetical protein